MIKNDQQLAVTSAQMDKLKSALAMLQTKDSSDPTTMLRIASLHADVTKLESQIEKYKQVARGNFDIQQISYVENVGEELIYARIASGLTQEELARKVGAKAQQIQRYERGHYLTASLKTLSKISLAIRRSYDEHRLHAL